MNFVIKFGIGSSQNKPMPDNALYCELSKTAVTAYTAAHTHC